MSIDDSIDYDIELDHGEWLPVPLEYPWNGYPDAVSWVSDVAVTLGRRVDAPPEVVDGIRESAQVVASVDAPFPGAVERFWHVDGPDRPLRVAHLYIAEYPDDGEAAARAIATAGIGGYVQVYEPLEDSPFPFAAKTVVLSQPDDPDAAPIVVARMIGFARGHVVIAEVVDDRGTLWLVIDALERLFRSLRLGGAGS